MCFILLFFFGYREEENVIKESHEEHHEKAQIAVADHDAHKEHGELLDEHINTLYKNAGDEITRINEEITQCTEKKTKLQRQVEEAKTLQSHGYQNTNAQPQHKQGVHYGVNTGGQAPKYDTYTVPQQSGAYQHYK